MAYELKQNVTFAVGTGYRLSFSADLMNNGISVYQGTQLVLRQNDIKAQMSSDFIADASGDYLSFVPVFSDRNMVITDISLKAFTDGGPADDARTPTKKFLYGTTDDGDEIFFRMDTVPLQLFPSSKSTTPSPYSSVPEIYATPISVITETERGITTKTFVGLDNEPFFELKGDTIKGISILKIIQDGQGKPRTALCQTMRLSYRDSSKQRCRVMHSAILYLPTPIDYSA
jgi:hypothetical protein